MAKTAESQKGLESKLTLKQIIKQSQVKYPYWLLIPKKGGPDPRVVDDGSFHFARHPYDSHRNAWCFENDADRAKMKAKHGGQSYDQFIPKEG